MVWKKLCQNSVSGWGSLEESNSALFFSSRWVSGVWFHQPTIQYFWDKPEGFFSGFLSLIFRGFFSLGRTLHIPELGTRDANLVWLVKCVWVGMGYIPRRPTSSSLSAAKKAWISGFKNNYEAYGVQIFWIKQLSLSASVIKVKWSIQFYSEPWRRCSYLSALFQDQTKGCLISKVPRSQP